MASYFPIRINKYRENDKKTIILLKAQAAGNLCHVSKNSSHIDKYD